MRRTSRVFIRTGFGLDQAAFAALRPGASRFLLKSASPGNWRARSAAYPTVTRWWRPARRGPSRGVTRWCRSCCGFRKSVFAGLTTVAGCTSTIWRYESRADSDGHRSPPGGCGRDSHGSLSDHLVTDANVGRVAGATKDERGGNVRVGTRQARPGCQDEPAERPGRRPGPAEHGGRGHARTLASRGCPLVRAMKPSSRPGTAYLDATGGPRRRPGSGCRWC
jgi:hypothetical protein